MDFKWFVNCKAYHKSYNHDLLFCALPEREICFWPVEMAWVKEVTNDGYEVQVGPWGSHGGQSERPSHLVARGKLILLLPQTGPWKISRAGRVLIYRQVFMEKQFLSLPKNTLPWLWKPEPRRTSLHITKHGNQFMEKQMWKYFIIILCLFTLNPLMHLFPPPLIGINNMVVVIFSYILIVSF